MKALKISPEDAELFQFEADPEKQNFYISHLDTFKRMWCEQGSTYWLRFLISFRSYFNNYNESKFLHLNPMCYHESEKILETGFIYIHKNFIECDHNIAKNLINNMFTVAKSSHLIPEMLSSSIVHDPFYNKLSRDAFRALFGVPNSDKKSTVVMVFIIFPMYTRFCAAICTLLKRWAAETDLIFENTDDIDNKHVYWMPFQEWSEETFVPSMFEKYISDYWKDNLPKMLLTCDVHNIFARDMAHGCKNFDCENIDDKSINNKKIHRFKSFYKPKFDFVLCKSHPNCHLKIQHSIHCSEPYFCEGSATCKSICETACNKQKRKPLKKGESIWKHFEVFVSKCKQKDKRNVSTVAVPKDNDNLVETFAPRKKCKQVSVNFMQEIMQHVESMQHAEVSNAFRQHLNIQETKERLRDKLSKRNKELFELDWNRIRTDSQAFKDQKYRLVLCEKANKKFQKELLSQIIYDKYTHCGFECFNDSFSSSETDTRFEDILQVMNSVAVGTDDIAWGKVFVIGKKISDQVKAQSDNSEIKCDINKSVTIQTNRELNKNINKETVDIETKIQDNKNSQNSNKKITKNSNKKNNVGINNIVCQSAESVDSVTTSNAEKSKNEKLSIAAKPDDQTNINKIYDKNGIAASETLGGKKVECNGIDKNGGSNKIKLDAPDCSKTAEKINKTDECSKKSVSNSKKNEAKNKQKVNKKKPLENSKNAQNGSNVNEKEVISRCDKIADEKVSKDAIDVKAELKKNEGNPPAPIIINETIAQTQYCLDNSEKHNQHLSESPAIKNLQGGGKLAMNAKPKSKTLCKSGSLLDCLATSVSIGNSIPKSLNLLSCVNLDIINSASSDPKSSVRSNTIKHILDTIPVSHENDEISAGRSNLDQYLPKHQIKTNVCFDAPSENHNILQDGKFECVSSNKSSSRKQYIDAILEEKKSREQVVDKASVLRQDCSNSLTVKESAPENIVDLEASASGTTVEKEFLNHFMNVKDESGIDNNKTLNKNKSVSENLDIIENSIKENDGLGYEEFLLMLETGNMLVGATSTEENTIKLNNNEKSEIKLEDTQFKICAFCQKKETQRKKFKKCSRCKLENFPQHRYYCSRECQAEDWTESHREEHLKNTRK